MAQHVYGDSLPAAERLDRALAVFLAQEIDEDEGEHDKVTLIGATLAAVTRTGTHNKAALKAASVRLLQPKPPRLLERVNTRAKRVALTIAPFLAIVALYRLAQDLDHYSWEPSLSFFLFTAETALCVLVALTRLGDWLKA